MEKSENGSEIDWLGLKLILDYIIQNGNQNGNEMIDPDWKPWVTNFSLKNTTHEEKVEKRLENSRDKTTTK